MGWLIISFCMALQTQLIGSIKNFSRMRVMAVAALYTMAKHFAFCKRCIDIAFLICLAIRMVMFCRGDFRDIVIHEFIALNHGGADVRLACMAGCTRI